MSDIRSIDKQILEKYFDMRGGYVLDFSNRTMEEYFMEEFRIHLYSKKYDTEGWTDSKANRLRGIWREESDEIVGKIILSLVEYDETMQDINPDYINPCKNLKPKVEAIAQKLLKNAEKMTRARDDRLLKSQNGYIAEIIALFKKEYAKLKLPGLTYDYTLGYNLSFLENMYPEPDSAVPEETKFITEKKKALEKLKEIGVIKTIDIDEFWMCDADGMAYDIAHCTIDESMLFQTEQQPSEKIIHEHSHRFENDVQSNPIEVNFNTQGQGKKTQKPRFNNLKWSNITLYTSNAANETISILYKIKDGKIKKFDLKEDLNINPQQEIMQVLSVLTLPGQKVSLQAIWTDRSSQKDDAKFRKQISEIRKKLNEFFNIDDDPIINTGNSEYQPKFDRGGILSDDLDIDNSISFDENIGMQY